MVSGFCGPTLNLNHFESSTFMFIERRLNYASYSKGIFAHWNYKKILMLTVGYSIDLSESHCEKTKLTYAVLTL